MWFHSSFLASQRLSNPAARVKRRTARRRAERRLSFEGLEERCLLAFNVLDTYADAAPMDILAAHIDAGSNLDLVVVGSNDSLTVRLGNGDGSFADPIATTVGFGPRSVAAGDLTGDGVTDVVVAGQFAVDTLIGLSKIRPTSAMDGVPLADRRHELQCGVSVVDFRNGEVVATLQFQTAVEEIFDVQLLLGARFPEVVGFQKDSLHHTFVVPPEHICRLDS